MRSVVRRLTRRALLSVHLAVGVVLVLFTSRMGCGEDECLQALVSASLAAAWLLATTAFVWLARSEDLGARVAAVMLLVLWVPAGWAAALVLFSLFPSLGGA
jgi:hypothetical protein